MTSFPAGEQLLTAAAIVHEELEKAGIRSAIIGAVALAARGYPRATADLDLATFTPPYPGLTQVNRALQARGLTAEFRDPDAKDPLGGVIRVEVDPVREIDVVNFLNPWSGGPDVIVEAIAQADNGLIEGCVIPVVTLPHLVAIKLYGGGPKNRLDVGELLLRQPDSLTETRALCERFGYERALDTVLHEHGLL